MSPIGSISSPRPPQPSAAPTPAAISTPAPIKSAGPAPASPAPSAPLPRAVYSYMPGHVPTPTTLGTPTVGGGREWIGETAPQPEKAAAPERGTSVLRAASAPLSASAAEAADRVSKAIVQDAAKAMLAQANISQQGAAGILFG